MAISTISTHPKFKFSKNKQIIKIPHFYPFWGAYYMPLRKLSVRLRASVRHFAETQNFKVNSMLACPELIIYIYIYIYIYTCIVGLLGSHLGAQENIRKCFRGARLLGDSATLHSVRFTLRMDILRLTPAHGLFDLL